MFYDSTTLRCIANITVNPALKNSMVFGHTWLTRYYSVFDSHNFTVGFFGSKNLTEL